MVLADHFLLEKAFTEHHFHPYGEEIPHTVNLDDSIDIIYFKNKTDTYCVSITQNRKVLTGYYVGVDWITKSKAIYVEPKLNKDSKQTDYLKMLFTAISDSDIAKHTDDLFEIKWELPAIIIEQKQDLLTPLLIVQFLKVVQEIVRKGLKKSYYKVEQNLHARVKGKINIGKTIKKNVLNNKSLNVYCIYEEFGFNCVENKLLKKALVFIQRYLPTLRNLHSESFATNIFNYINPAFQTVSEDVSISEVTQTKFNPFFKEYSEAIYLAKTILRRFGYNISNTDSTKIATPPFWIDMSKLFELYVLAQLKRKYSNHILYGTKEAKGKYGLPDFLLIKNDELTIIDAKYKPIYQDNKYDIENIRQLSGYSRDERILDKLGFKSVEEKENAVVKCLMIYPDQSKAESIWQNQEASIEGFVKFYKRPVKLPLIN